MVETSKQVRVDNWGVFFLSRLQVFFNKTDYCDLTLQFEGNVQLKVHRLVMNACTEYFQILEESCEVVDDVLMMPPELQADVILPIVNFMYTGMLEFQMSIFERLYKTAEMMNITVLLQLLDAQKQPKLANKLLEVQKQPKFPNKQMQQMSGVQGVKRKIEKPLPATLPGRKLPVWKRKNAPTLPQLPTPTSTFANEPRRKCLGDPGFDNSPKPTRFEWPEDDLKHFSLLDSSFDNISYTSKPLLTQEEELRASTSFDSVRYLPNSNKRVQDYNSSNVDMDDLKSYVKEQKIRSDMVDFEDEDIDNNVDDPDYIDTSQQRKSASKKVRFSLNEKENKEAKFNVSSSTSTKPDVDHSKIISEVLKKYPHLVKKNKNIRLKILAKNKDNTKTDVRSSAKVKVQMKPAKPQVTKELKSADDGPWSCHKCFLAGEEAEFVLYYLYRKHMTDVHNEKFDSRMCKYCGHKSNKHNMMMYHQYTKHGIKPPPAYNFPRCNRCLYVALTENLMIKHKLNHTKFDLQCAECKVGFNSEMSLKHHVQITGHSGKSGRNNYDCQYCTKHYQTGSNLFSHIRLMHRDEARRDGIVAIDEEDELPEDDEEEEVDGEPKIKILSDVSLQDDPLKSPAPPNPQPQETESALPSLGLVDIVVLDESQQYIQQLVTQEPQEFILPTDHNFIPNPTDHNVMLGNSDIGSTDELVMVLTDHDYNDGNNEILTQDNSNIVVLYSHPVEGQTGQFITSQGNIMLNSETGMLELRNGADSSTLDTGTVESIELIQREIESHTNPEVKAVPLPPPQETIVNIPDSTATYHPEESEIHHPEEQEYIVEEEILKPNEENVVGGKDQQHNVDQTQPNEAEPMEVDEEITSSEIPAIHQPVIENTQTQESLIEILQDKIDTTPIQEEIKEPEPEPQPQQPDPPPISDTHPEQTAEEEMLIHENVKLLQPVNTENIEVQNVAEKPAAAPLSAEEIPSEVRAESVDIVEPTIILEKNNTGEPIVAAEEQTIEQLQTEKPVTVEDIPYNPEPMDVDGKQEEKTEEKDEVKEIQEITKEDSTSDSVVESVNPSESASTDETTAMSEEPETVKPTITTPVDSQDEVDSQNSVDRLKTAKSLLDDWEDTDSQQSEHGKSVNTVNKLINDWDDD